MKSIFIGGGQFFLALLEELLALLALGLDDLLLEVQRIFIHFVFLQRTILLISNEQLYNRLKNMILQQTIEQAIPQNTQ